MSTDSGFQDRLQRIQERADERARSQGDLVQSEPQREVIEAEQVAAPTMRASAGPVGTPFLLILGAVAIVGAGAAIYVRDYLGIQVAFEDETEVAAETPVEPSE